MLIYCIFTIVKNYNYEKFNVCSVFLGFFSFISAQEKVDVNEFNSVIEIEIFHDNGEVYQKGSLKNNKLHGKLESYDYSGNLVVLGEFKNGKKKVNGYFGMIIS